MNRDAETEAAPGAAGEGADEAARTEAAETEAALRGADEAARLFAELAPRFLTAPGVSQGTGFGSHPGLRVGGKIFAMIGRGELVVKLPRERVDELSASGVAARFEPRRDGRVMKEWASVPVSLAGRWETLVREALEFVGPSVGIGRS